MKKGLLIFGLLILGKFGLAATPTPTFTATLTSTPTPTNTPTAVAIKNTNLEREQIPVNRFTKSDGITSLGTSVDTANPYYIQAVSNTCAVLGTATAKVRFQWVVPNDYKNNLKFYAYCYLDTVGVTTCAITVDTAIQHFNALTSTSTVYTGTSTNIQQYNAGMCCPLQDGVMGRFFLPLSSTVVSVPEVGIVHKGDIINCLITRSAGSSGNLYICDIEAEYNYNFGIRP